MAVAPNCSSSPSSDCSTRARCTGTSCASGSTPRSGRSVRCPTAPSTRPARPARPGLDRRGDAPATARPRRAKRARIVYELTQTARNSSRSSSTRPGRRPGRTTSSTSTWPSSPAPTPRSGCASSRGAAAGSRSGSTQIREVSARNRERLDAYTTALQRHGEESAEREVRWLNELITHANVPPGDPRHTTAAPPPRPNTPGYR